MPIPAATPLKLAQTKRQRQRWPDFLLLLLQANEEGQTGEHQEARTSDTPEGTNSHRKRNYTVAAYPWTFILTSRSGAGECRFLSFSAIVPPSETIVSDGDSFPYSWSQICPTISDVKPFENARAAQA